VLAYLETSATDFTVRIAKRDRLQDLTTGIRQKTAQKQLFYAVELGF
jgi:hypothetical protein